VPRTDLAQMTIAELRGGYAARAFSPLEAVTRMLERIEAGNPELHAFTTLAAERALAEARSCGDELTHGYSRGPLHGVPFAAKDLFDSAGLRTTYGSPIFADHVPAEDATAIRRLRDAGAILVGKTATHEFAWGITTASTHFGATRNPWSTSVVAGGSSGGSAVALATGMVPAALGTDTGGSIRIPAAYCGVVGLKPTFARVSTKGVFPLAPSLDHIGPMARTVEDAALLLEVLAGFEPGDSSTAAVAAPSYSAAMQEGIASLRIGICEDLLPVPLSTPVRRAFDNCMSVLAGLGARLVDVSLPSAGLIDDAYLAIQPAEAYHVHHTQRALFLARRSMYGPDVAVRLEKAEAVSLADYLEAQQARRQVQADFAQLFAAQIDLLLSPVSAGPPVHVGDEELEHEGRRVSFRSLVMPFTRPQSIAGLPACAIRAGFDEHGVPVGMQLTGPPWSEPLVLRAAHALYTATPEIQTPWPPYRAGAAGDEL
jgi:aspartyl-tRNA(Asn)/glutamyl-tRNA(Gln) amidotransferase subunit A